MRHDDALDISRRRLLQAGAAGALLAACSPDPPIDPVAVEDVARLERMPVAHEARPRSTQDISSLIGQWDGPLSIGGGRFSMGGQIAAAGSLHLDMRAMNRVLRLDPQARVVRAQAGTTWRDLQEGIDPHDLSVAVMQSYSNFTLGGSVSVNCHGRYVGKGPIANTVRALRLVTADGQELELTRHERPDLFAAVIGGYGGLGVITEVELDLDRNAPLERRVERIALADYPEYFRQRLLTDPTAVLHNADLTPPHFDQPLAITWRTTDLPVTVAHRLIPRDVDYARERALIWAVSELPIGSKLRDEHHAEMLSSAAPVVWRNHEASLDAAMLEPKTRYFATYLLQEYFIPVAHFAGFVAQLARVLVRSQVNALNVSIRHSPADTVSLLRWAPGEVFCFVLYYKQPNNARGAREAQRWTQELIEAALNCDGRYYLPYRLHATPEQFLRAYPEARQFARLKATVDPQGRFRNRLWDAYLPQAAAG